jgi:hypothetical protein
VTAVIVVDVIDLTVAAMAPVSPLPWPISTVALNRPGNGDCSVL